MRDDDPTRHVYELLVGLGERTIHDPLCSLEDRAHNIRVELGFHLQAPFLPVNFGEVLFARTTRIGTGSVNLFIFRYACIMQLYSHTSSCPCAWNTSRIASTSLRSWTREPTSRSIVPPSNNSLLTPHLPCPAPQRSWHPKMAHQQKWSGSQPFSFSRISP